MNQPTDKAMDSQNLLKPATVSSLFKMNLTIAFWNDCMSNVPAFL